MTTLELDFSARPVVLIRGRQFVLLDDVRTALGVQLLAAGDMTSLMSTTDPEPEGEQTVPAWYDGSGVCYVRHRGSAPRQLPVTGLPLWIGVDVKGELAQLLMPA